LQHLANSFLLLILVLSSCLKMPTPSLGHRFFSYKYSSRLPICPWVIAVHHSDQRITLFGYRRFCTAAPAHCVPLLTVVPSAHCCTLCSPLYPLLTIVPSAHRCIPASSPQPMLLFRSVSYLIRPLRCQGSAYALPSLSSTY
jgi:hypothetical protein